MTDPLAMMGNEQLESLRNRLISVQAGIEARFLAAGEVLCQAVDGIGSLISGLDRLTDALDPAVTSATTADLGLAAAKLSALPAAQFRRRRVVEALLEHRTSLAQCTADMQRSLSYMRVFSINIKITASAIATNDPEFGLFAHDISRCIEIGGHEIACLGADVTGLEAKLHKAQATIGALEARCHAMIPATPERLIASSAAIGHHHHQVAAAAEAAGKMARDVRTKVGRVLSALQIGDSTSQRVDHVQAGLGFLARYQVGLSPDQSERIGSFVHALLAAQLTAALVDFGHNVAEINASMVGLSDDLNKLLRLRDTAYGQTAGEQDGIVRTLGREIDLALGLVSEIEAADRAATQTGVLVVDAASDLATRITSIQAIKADVNYMAINTTLRSNRVGEAGRPLRVVAVELGQHGGDLENAAAACIAILDKLVGSAAELGDAKTGEGYVETEAQAAAAALGAASTRLRNAGDRTETDIAALASEGKALFEAMAQFIVRFDLPGELGETLGAIAAALADRGSPATAVTEDIEGPLRQLLEDLGAIYTMAQERVVQAEMAADWGLCDIMLDPTANLLAAIAV